MSYIDVLIPGIAGVLLLVGTRWFIKPSGDVNIDAPKLKKLRIIGCILIGVAALYGLIKFEGA